MEQVRGRFLSLTLMWLVPILTVLGRSIDFRTNNMQNGYGESEDVEFGNETQRNYWNVEKRIKRETIDSENCRNRSNEIAIFGLNFEYASDKKKVDLQNDEIHMVEGLEVGMRLYGRFVTGTQIRFTKNAFSCRSEDLRGSEIFDLNMIGINENENYRASYVRLVMPERHHYQEVHFCLKHPKDMSWCPQGHAHWIFIKLEYKLLPAWLHLFLIIILLVLSGLFSGLNLGLMSLNKTDLKIITNTGSAAERGYAAKIAPVRRHGNFLLCCLLFSNVLVNASLTILVDELTTGAIAIVMSTLAIVIFGEIVPQSICSRFGLAVGAKTILITKFFMGVTFPLAYPLSKVLDKFLGEEIGSVYTRERLKELLKVTKKHHGLEVEEVGIISGALDMKSKAVKEIMTSLDGVFMVSIDLNLDFDTIREIDFQGYTRIPVYDKSRSNVVGLLNVKQLTLLDGSDNIPIRTVIEYYNITLFYVFENTRLDYMFRAFREGNRGHMAFVQKVTDDGTQDPYYETVGIVTLEDVLEELLQAEIMDESDVGKSEARLLHKEHIDAPFASHRKRRHLIEVQPQLALAATQYLTTSVPAFDRKFVSETVVERLLSSTVYMEKPIKWRAFELTKNKYLYKAGKVADSFIMILEGKVEVQVGAELLLYEAGPFHQFGSSFLLKEYNNDLARLQDTTPQVPGTPALGRRTFIPDYSVRIIQQVFFMRIKYSNYVAARKATHLERLQNDPKRPVGDDYESEIERVLNTIDQKRGIRTRVYVDDDSVISTPAPSGLQTPQRQADPRPVPPFVRPTSPGESSNKSGPSEPGEKSETKNVH